MGGHLLDEPDGEGTYEDPLKNATRVFWRYAALVLKWAFIGACAALVLFVLFSITVVGWRMHQHNRAWPLMEAAADGDVARARELLEDGRDPDGRTLKGRLPLSEAARAGNTEIVELLLEHGAEPTEWAMKTAREAGHYDVAKLIEQHLAGEELDEADDAG